MGNLQEAQRALEVVALLESSSADRKTIAEALGISLSAAGTTVNALISSGIAGEYQRKNAGQGRRTGVVYLKNDPVFAVGYISAGKITTSSFGFGLSIYDTYYHNIDDPLFIDDCFISYFRGVARHLPKMCGICLVCKGIPTDTGFTGSFIPGLDTLPLRDIASEQLGDRLVLLENSSLYIPERIDGMNLVISEDHGIVKVSLIHNGILISGIRSRSGDLGHMIDFEGRSLAARFKYSKNNADYISAMAFLFNEVILLCGPDRIYFSSEKYRSLDMLLSNVKESLILNYGHSVTELPDMHGFTFENNYSHTGLLRKLRDEYIFDLFLKNEQNKNLK